MSLLSLWINSLHPCWNLTDLKLYIFIHEILYIQTLHFNVLLSFFCIPEQYHLNNAGFSFGTSGGLSHPQSNLSIPGLALNKYNSLKAVGKYSDMLLCAQTYFIHRCWIISCSVGCHKQQSLSLKESGKPSAVVRTIGALHGLLCHSRYNLTSQCQWLHF